MLFHRSRSFRLQEQNRAAETFELNTTNLEEQLQLQTEAASWTRFTKGLFAYVYVQYLAMQLLCLIENLCFLSLRVIWCKMQIQNTIRSRILGPGMSGIELQTAQHNGIAGWGLMDLTPCKGSSNNQHLSSSGPAAKCDF